MIFETRCAGCDKPGNPVCTTCRLPLLAAAPRDAPHGALAAVPFAGRARRVLLGWSYRNRRSVSRHLAGLIVNQLVAARAHQGLDIITWVPTSPKRRRERGFDPGELLARVVARQLGLPCRRLLNGDASAWQTGRSGSRRLHELPFVARSGLEGLRVLVVDDVVATGSTLAAAAAALHDRGAEARLAAVASTPDRRSAVVLPFARRAAAAAA
mgnify:CR=1 FL=1